METPEEIAAKKKAAADKKAEAAAKRKGTAKAKAADAADAKAKADEKKAEAKAKAGVKKTAAKAKSDVQPVVSVKTVRGVKSRRRIGRSFGPEPVNIPLADLGEGEHLALEADLKLVVELAE